MSTSPWTEDALLAVKRLRRKQDWPDFHAAFPTISYDAWEVKRRRVKKDLEAEAALADQAAGEALIEDRLRKLNSDGHADSGFKPSLVPHIAKRRESPAFSGFTMAFFDIEATDLKGNFGRILCMSVVDSFGTTRDDVKTFRLDDPEYAGETRRDDSKLVAAIRDYLETFDVWVGWNSKLYDIPFIDTRLLINDLAPIRKDIMHIDPMWKAGQGSLTLHSRRLDAVAKTFRLDDQKTPLDPDIWMAASDGEREAMDYVVEHCENDVLVLRHAFAILKPLIRKVHR